MDKIILCWGGLGDNLSLSTLPEAFSNEGYDVYLSSQNIYRNNGIYDLVWRDNPYIKGISEAEPNSGFIYSPKYDGSKEFIEVIELTNGILNPTGNIYPKIYYNPKFRAEYRDLTVVNFSSISEQYNMVDIKLGINRLPFDLYAKPFIELKSSFDINENGARLYGNSEIRHDLDGAVIYYKDIYHMCDIIHSCKRFITINSGAAVLASALNKTETYIILKASLLDSYYRKNFIFNNLKYII